MTTTPTPPTWAASSRTTDAGTIHEAEVGPRVTLQRVDFREDGGRPGTPVVVLDGDALDRDEAEALAADLRRALDLLG